MDDAVEEMTARNMILSCNLTSGGSGTNLRSHKLAGRNQM